MLIRIIIYRVDSRASAATKESYICRVQEKSDTASRDENWFTTESLADLVYKLGSVGQKLNWNGIEMGIHRFGFAAEDVRIDDDRAIMRLFPE